MTPRTRIEPRPAALRSPKSAVGLFLGAAVLAVLLVAPALDDGTFVARLTIDNPTVFDVNVEVADPGREGWLDHGTIDRETQGVLEEVADPGGTWVFRFTYAGVQGGDLIVPRLTLRQDGWRLAIPTEVGEKLTEAGFAPSSA